LIRPSFGSFCKRGRSAYRGILQREVAKQLLSVVIDDYSRTVAGYFLSFEDPSAPHTSLALRQAIWRREDSRWIACGIPDVLYADIHGKKHSLPSIACAGIFGRVPNRPWYAHGKNEEEAKYCAVRGVFEGVDAIKELREVIRRAQVLVMQNEVLDATNVAAAQSAKDHGIRVILNAAPARPLGPDLSANVDLP
jgi:hypothetical protein